MTMNPEEKSNQPSDNQQSHSYNNGFNAAAYNPFFSFPQPTPDPKPEQFSAFSFGFPQKPAAPEPEPEKRKSIDDSWVNVGWNEVKSPAKSPRLEESIGGASNLNTGNHVEMKPKSPIPHSLPTHSMEMPKFERSKSPVMERLEVNHFGIPRSENVEKPKPSSTSSSLFERSEIKSNSMVTDERVDVESMEDIKPKEMMKPPKSPQLFSPPVPQPSKVEERLKPVEKLSTPTPSKIEKSDVASTSTKPTPKRTPKKSSPQVTPRSSGRARKTVDRLSPEPEKHEAKQLEIPSGSGVKLGEIPHLSKELGKRKSDYEPIVLLHRVVFGRPGEATRRKANLRNFCGFPDSHKLSKVTTKLDHHSVDELRDLCSLLNLERGGEKKSLVERIGHYLKKPIDLGESKASPVKRAPKKGKAPKSKKPRTTTKKRAKKDTEPSEGVKSSESDNDEMELADLDSPDEEKESQIN